MTFRESSEDDNSYIYAYRHKSEQDNYIMGKPYRGERYGTTHSMDELSPETSVPEIMLDDQSNPASSIKQVSVQDPSFKNSNFKLSTVG